MIKRSFDFFEALCGPRVTYAFRWFFAFLLAANLIVMVFGQYTSWRDKNPPTVNRLPSRNLFMKVESMYEGDVRWVLPGEIAVDPSQKVWINPNAATLAAPLAGQIYVQVFYRNRRYGIAIPPNIAWDAKELLDGKHMNWQYVAVVETLRSETNEKTINPDKQSSRVPTFGSGIGSGPLSDSKSEASPTPESPVESGVGPGQ